MYMYVLHIQGNMHTMMHAHTHMHAYVDVNKLSRLGGKHLCRIDAVLYVRLPHDQKEFGASTTV